MDDKIEAWVRHGKELVNKLATEAHLRGQLSELGPWNECGEYGVLLAHLRTTPEGFVLMPTKLSRAMEAVLENEKGAYQTGDDLYADLIAASQESAALKEQSKC